MPYDAAEGRYDRKGYRRCGRSGLDLPLISLGLWHNFGATRRSGERPHRAAARLRPRHHPFRPGQQLRPAVRLRRDDLRPRSSPRTCARTATSSSSRPRPATTCGRAPTATGARASTCSPASTRAWRGWASTTSTSSTPTGPTPTTPLEETMGALDTAVRQGKALYAGISSVLPRAHRRGGDDPARARHAAAHPPALVLDAQPVDRARPARRPGRRGRRLHRLLPARPGPAHRPLPRRRARGLARHARAGPSSRGLLSEREPRTGARAQRDRQGPRAVARADGDRLGAARPARHLAPSSGASSVAQLEENVAALDELDFTAEELEAIDEHATDVGIDIWASSREV